LLEIGVRARDQQAVIAGLETAIRLASDGVSVGITDPLYWLRREPVYRDQVLPQLQALATFDGWRDEAEATITAYHSGAPHGPPPWSD